MSVEHIEGVEAVNVTGEAAVGWRVQVYWSKYSKYYVGEVLYFDDRDGCYDIFYDGAFTRPWLPRVIVLWKYWLACVIYSIFSMPIMCGGASLRIAAYTYACVQTAPLAVKTSTSW